MWNCVSGNSADGGSSWPSSSLLVDHNSVSLVIIQPQTPQPACVHFSIGSFSVSRPFLFSILTLWRQRLSTCLFTFCRLPVFNVFVWHFWQCCVLLLLNFPLDELLKSFPLPQLTALWLRPCSLSVTQQQQLVKVCRFSPLTAHSFAHNSTLQVLNRETQKYVVFFCFFTFFIQISSQKYIWH